MRLLALRIAAACVLAVAISGCENSPGKPKPDSAILRPEEELSFDVLYRGNCAGCHGADGKNGAAIELANPEYQAWVDGASFRKWIAGGMPQTQMPAFATSAGGPLTDRQIEVLIRGMRQRWARQFPAQLKRMPPYGQPVDADAGRGAQVFARSCRSCHRQSKQGITSPDYLALMSDQALRAMIVVGVPDIGEFGFHADPMGTLTVQNLSDVVKFLGSLRSAAPGQPYPANPEGAE
jgi:cytochrome c oxidase cbb3-type subunit 3/ubiquinol-cytochrome c reductase cytochrome c subunit